MIKFLLAGFTFLIPLLVMGQNGQPVWSSYCETCHSSENPTREDPRLTICPRRGGHFEGEHGVQEGPEIVILDQLANIYGPVPFAHKLHASMADMSGGCTFCHHYSEIDKEVPPCRECHSEKRQLGDLRQPGLKGAYHRQCIACHREWSHETGCVACHEVKEVVAPDEITDKSDILGIPHPRITAEQKYVYRTPYETASVVTFHHSDHVDQFGLKCANCHQGDNCGRCHDIGHRVVAIEHVKTCITCHREDDCLFCHSTEEKPPFDHAISIGWELGKYHEKSSCQACHGPTKEFVLPSRTCTSCHIHWEVGSFEHRVTGLILNEDHEEFDCYDCHVDENFETLPTCDNCHEDITYPKFIPGKKTKG